MRTSIHKRKFQRKQGGFSLIELLIAVIIIGVLVAIAIAGFGTGATTNARAKSIMSAATKLSNNWVYVATGLGVSTNITTAEDATNGIFDQTPLDTDAPLTVLGLLMENNGANLETQALRDKFTTLGIRSLQDLGSWDTSSPPTGTDGIFTLDVHPVTMSSDATNGNIQVIFSNIPWEIVQVLESDRGPGVIGYTGQVAGTIPAVAPATFDSIVRLNFQP